ncbi:HNH endonuclease signature motif containing protein [Tomitella biformata]|uniref:HNH endonuclease signature motif containing protein n=1 Tax=Tomitella biformata TaxID=630403 RepID=UPI0004B8476F|nr:HNH endonuclease signature motif containing protein [Tomitella biformata]
MSARLAADVVELRLLGHITLRDPICGADKAAARWLHSHSADSLAESRTEVTFAIRICEHHPVLACYAHAEISRRVAKRILQFLAYPPKNLDEEHIPAVRDRLLKAARTRDPQQLLEEEERLRQAFSDDVPPSADHDRNRLTIDELLGRVIVQGDLDAETGAKLQEALSPFMVPRPEPDGAPDRRPTPQRRAEALSDLLDAALAAANFPNLNGERPRLMVDIPLEDLMRGIPTHEERIAMIRNGRIDEYFAANPVGWNHWMGAVSLATAQRLACDCELTMIGTDEHGAPLTVHTGDRFASKRHRQALAHRDRGCAFPRCNRPASMTQAHHMVFWEHGGHTQIDNLVSLCGEHHRAVHHHGWHVAMAKNRFPVFRPPPKFDPLRRWLNSAGEHVDGPEAPPGEIG